MQLIQASTIMDSTHAMQLKFEQKLDDRIKYELANQIAQQLIESNQFIIQVQEQFPAQYHYYRNTITFSVELYISYKKDSHAN